MSVKNERKIEDENLPVKGRVLAVDDEPVSMDMLEVFLEEMNFQVFKSASGKEALDILDHEYKNIDVIVLDKNMPGMDGLEVMKHLHESPRMRHIPVVMSTASSRPEEVQEGIEAGVFYYLTKPFEAGVFGSVMESAMREAHRRQTLKNELKRHQSSFSFINNADFTIRTMEDAENLACFIANCFPNPDTALPGLAALMVNAVEHGNLEIGYKDKGDLLSAGEWRKEIDRRLNDEQYENRKVRVKYQSNKEKVDVLITDEGQGFEYKDYLEISPERALESHGRGIAQANKISFDELSYNDKGNEVRATTYKTSGIKW